LVRSDESETEAEVGKPHTLSSGTFFEYMGSSPRLQILDQAATSAIKEERKRKRSDTAIAASFEHFRQPMALLIQIFNDISDKNEDFWFIISPFFKREFIPAGTVLWNQDVFPSVYPSDTGRIGCVLSP
jgi:sulfate permease, SulP family